MKKSAGILLLLLTVVVVFFFSGCGRSRRNHVAPFGWTAENPVADSLTVRMEYAFLGEVPVDSLARLVDEFETAVSRMTADDEEKSHLKGCALFWKARLKYRLGRFGEARKLIGEAVALTDSARYPYEIRRYRWLVENRGAYSIDQWYEHISDEIKFYRKHHCVYMLVSRYLDMSWLMLEAGYSARTIEYLSMADSLLDGIDELTVVRAGLRINLADMYCTVGDSLRAAKMLREIGECPEVLADGYTSSLIDFNLWVTARDTVALRRVWDSLSDDSVRIGLRGVVSAFMARVSLDRGDTRGAREYIADTRRFLPAVTQGDHKAFMLRTMAETAGATGDDRSAVECYSRYAEVTDSLNAERQRGELISAETSRQIDMAEERARGERRMLIFRFTAVIAVFIIAVVVVWIQVRRRITRLRDRHHAERLDRLKSQRAELAMTLRMTEKENMLGELDGRLADLARKGNVSAGDISAVQSGIRAVTAAEAESENFAEVFARISPAFTDNLRRAYPNVRRSSERLACYIALGLDTRHIARVMNIRPESVRQARWRLRSQMELPADSDLDQALKDLL